MSKTWLMGDTHLGHSNIITFKDNDGNLIRPFKDINEHDEILISNFNALVNPEDRVYFLGDLAFNNTNLQKINRMNGRKKLIKGNHDLLAINSYTKIFDDICAYRIYPDSGIIVSHIPVHPAQLERRFKLNVHGHLHANIVTQIGSKVPDKRYMNICPEHTEWKPVNLQDIIDGIKE